METGRHSSRFLCRPTGYAWHPFSAEEKGAWIRVTIDAKCQATVWFEMRNPDHRRALSQLSSEPLDSHASQDSAVYGSANLIGGLVRAGDRDSGLKILATKVTEGVSQPAGYYELKPDLSLIHVDSEQQLRRMAEEVAIPTGVLQLDGNSILYVDDDGQRYRLPIGNPIYREHPELMDLQRTSREAATERDLFQCAGTFFELPARNAGGFAKIRPIATHPLFVQDYCSWRGLLVLSGIATERTETNSHIVRSPDGCCAVWLGAVDDLWSLGKPVGRGGPWSNSPVKAGQPSDPYLLTGYHHRQVTVTHNADSAVTFRLEVDISGTGNWYGFRSWEVPAGDRIDFEFPPGFEAYWVRLVASRDCEATAEFVYR